MSSRSTCSTTMVSGFQPTSQQATTSLSATSTYAHLHVAASGRIELGPGAKMPAYQTTSIKVDTDGPNPSMWEVQPGGMGGSQR